MRREEGFTIVEVLVAIVILAVGAVAVLGTFDASTRNTFRAEQSQVAIDRAQAELEKIRHLSYQDVALTTTPAHSDDSNDPRNRVSGNQFDLDRNGLTATDPHLVVAGIGGVTAGSVSPGPTSFRSGDVTGHIYRFVVWQDDPNCVACGGTHDYKRVIVAITLDTVAISYARSYVEVQSNFTDPDASPVPQASPPGGDPLTAQQFFLSDSTCNRDAAVPPENLTDHPEHQTTGVCTEANPAKPDGLYIGAPPDIDADDPNLPPFHDFATDVEPTNPSDDRGLQMLAQDTNGCTFQPPSEPYKYHRWLTPPMPVNFVMGGQGTLKLWTKTIRNVSAAGTVCIFLFIRNEVTDPRTGEVTSYTDTVLNDKLNPSNNFWTWSQNPWPKGDASCGTGATYDPACGWALGTPTPIMNFCSPSSPQGQCLATTVLAGERLGLEIAIRRNGTTVTTPEGGNQLEFIYDHPDYPSRLEVQTPAQLP
jgi:prepilin-type N-terminal cleavage/methylation domain-containing protein